MFGKTLCTWLLIGACVFAGDPSIKGSVETASPQDNTIRVKMGSPPWVDISVKDAPEKSVQSWSGPIGVNQVGRAVPNGVAISTAVPGSYSFRCILQTPKEGLDDVKILETVVVVEGSTPKPDPEPVPVPLEGMTKIVAGNLKPIVAAHSDPNDKLLLAATAMAYVQASQEVKDGKITTVDKLLDRTKELTHAALKDRYSVLWEPVVRKVELELQRLGDAGKLPDLKSHLPLWDEVAKGISQAVGI